MVRKTSKNDIGERKPSFFKILMPGYSTQRLEIPKMFLKHIMHELSERATLKLEVSPGCSWHVKMRTTAQGQVLFEDGWEKFLKDNSLGSKDVLFFFYDGKMQFTISVFDSNGCDRVDFPTIKPHQKSSFVDTTKRPRGRQINDRSIHSSKRIHALNSSTDDSVEILSSFESSELKEFIKEDEDSENYACENSSKHLHASNSSTDDSVEILVKSESIEQKEFYEEEDSKNCASEESKMGSDC